MVLCAMMMLFTGITVKPVSAASTETIKLEGKFLYKETKEVLDLMNKDRQKKGLSKLTMDQNLCDYAEVRAAETMVYFSHTRPNGESYFTAGNSIIGENIASGQQDAKEVYDSWYNSPAHYENMMRQNYKSIGIAAFQGSDGRIAWVQLFGFSVNKTKSNYPNDKTKTMSVVCKKNLNTYEISFDDYAISTLQAGEKYEAGVYGDNGMWGTFNLKPTFTFSSSNTSVVKVDSKGNVYTLKNGTAVITAKGQGMVVKQTVKVTGNYKIEYVTNGGKLHEYSSKNYTYDITLKSPTKSGYLFSGWYTTKNFDPATKVKTLSRENVKVYAKWSTINLKAPQSLTTNIGKSSKKLCVNYDDVAKADGYQLYISTNKNFSSKTTTKVLVEDSKYVTDFKVKSGKTYYVKVRAFRNDSCGERIYGGFTEVKKIKA